MFFPPTHEMLYGQLQISEEAYISGVGSLCIDIAYHFQITLDLFDSPLQSFAHYDEVRDAESIGGGEESSDGTTLSPCLGSSNPHRPTIRPISMHSRFSQAEILQTFGAP